MKANSKRRETRVSAAIIAMAIVGAAFVALGGAGLGFSAVSQAQKQYGGKITICHRGHHMVKISAKAWPAHKRHGDILGVCARKKGKPAVTGGKNASISQTSGSGDQAGTNGNGKAKGKGKDK
jgi:hypothetical protein